MRVLPSRAYRGEGADDFLYFFRNEVKGSAKGALWDFQIFEESRVSGARCSSSL